MYFRNINPSTTDLYSDASMLPRRTQAASPIYFSKPILLVFVSAIEATSVVYSAQCAIYLSVGTASHISPMSHFRYSQMRSRIERATSSFLFNLLIVPGESSVSFRKRLSGSPFQSTLPIVFYSLSSWTAPHSTAHSDSHFIIHRKLHKRNSPVQKFKIKFKFLDCYTTIKKPDQSTGKNQGRIFLPCRYSA